MNDFAYATLSQVKQATNSQTTTDDAVLQDYIYMASSAINDFTGTWFTPLVATFDYAISSVDRYNGLLNLNRDLQVLDSVAFAGVTQSTGTFRKSPSNASPAVSVYGSTWSQTTPDDISITGTWCYHDRYASAYTLQGLLLGDVTDSETVMPVADTGLEAGQVLRINDELMQVVSTATNAVTVTRSAFGSTATAHTTGDSVDYFIPMRTVQQACARWSAFMYTRQAGFEAYTFQPDSATITFPSDMPSDVQGLLKRLRIAPRITTV